MTNQEIITRGELIRDETVTGANTAQRVGEAFVGIGQNLEELAKSMSLNSLYVSTLTEKTKFFVATEEGGLYVVDENGNIAFKVVMGNIDALGLGNNLTNIVKELVGGSGNIATMILAINAINEKLGNIPYVGNGGALYITDPDANIGWYFKPIVTNEQGVFFVDENGYIGIKVVNGRWDFSGLGDSIVNTIKDECNINAIEDVHDNANDNYADLLRIKGEIEESVNSMISLIDTNVPSENRIEKIVTVPASTTETPVSHGMVRLGLHYGSKPSFVSHDAINDNLAIWDDVYFDGKCRKDFSDIRVFNSDGDMLPFYMICHGNYEVCLDNNFRFSKIMADGNGNLYNWNKVSRDNGVTWTTLFYKPGTYLIGIDDDLIYYFCSRNDDTYVSVEVGDIISFTHNNGTIDTSSARVICHTWYYNYYYHAAITVNGTATEDGVLVLQASPSSAYVNRYEIPITAGMTGEDVCAKIAELEITQWTSNYESGNTITINSTNCLVYIEPEVEGYVRGLITSVNVTKDNAEAYHGQGTPRGVCIYTDGGHKYVFIASYQENTNVLVQRSIDGGNFDVVLDNQIKYDVTGRNGQHVHHIDRDPINGIIYVGIDHSGNGEFGPSVMRSYDNGDSWDNFEFTPQQVKTDKNAKLWHEHRARDFTPSWFSSDGKFSLGGGETNVLGGFTLIRIDNTEAVEKSNPLLADKKMCAVVDNGQSVRNAIASLGDDFIVAPIVSGICHNTAQLILSCDKGKTWRTIWHHEDPMAYRHVGNGVRYRCECQPNGDEQQIIFTGQTEDDKYNPLRIYKGGNHYYAEILVDVGNLPADGMTLMLKNGYAMKFPNKMPFNREAIIEPIYSIKFDKGIGNKVTDSLGNVAEIVGSYEWKEEISRFGNMLPSITEYKRSYSLRLDIGSYINFGKIPTLDFTRGFTVVLMINDNFRGNVAHDEYYYGYCPIVTFGNFGIYTNKAGYAVGKVNANTYASKDAAASVFVGTLNKHAIRVSSDNLIVESEGVEVDTGYPNVNVKTEEGSINQGSQIKFGNDNFEYVRLSSENLVIGSPNTETGSNMVFTHPRISISEIRFYAGELTDQQVDSIIFGYTRRFEQNYR